MLVIRLTLYLVEMFHAVMVLVDVCCGQLRFTVRCLCRNTRDSDVFSDVSKYGRPRAGRYLLKGASSRTTVRLTRQVKPAPELLIPALY